MIQASITGAAYDDWSEGWMVAHLQKLFFGRWPPRILDIEFDIGYRPYRETAQAAGSTIVAVDRDQLRSTSGAYDLVLALSFQRSKCLESVDPDQPYQQVESLATAARFLAPGGILIWSYLYVYAEDCSGLHSLLEPAAVYRSMLLRGLLPVAGDGPVGRIRMYHDPDAIFVPHAAIVPHEGRQRRVIRILGAVQRQSMQPISAPPLKRKWPMSLWRTD